MHIYFKCYYTNQEQQTSLELQVHLLDSLGPFEWIVSAHLSLLVELSRIGRAHESSVPRHAVIKRWCIGGIHSPSNWYQAWVTRRSYQQQKVSLLWPMIWYKGPTKYPLIIMTPLREGYKWRRKCKKKGVGKFGKRETRE